MLRSLILSAPAQRGGVLLLSFNMIAEKPGTLAAQG